MGRASVVLLHMVSVSLYGGISLCFKRPPLNGGIGG